MEEKAVPGELLIAPFRAFLSPGLPTKIFEFLHDALSSASALLKVSISEASTIRRTKNNSASPYKCHRHNLCAFRWGSVMSDTRVQVGIKKGTIIFGKDRGVAEILLSRGRMSCLPIRAWIFFGPHDDVPILLQRKWLILRFCGILPQTSLAFRENFPHIHVTGLTAFVSIELR